MRRLRGNEIQSNQLKIFGFAGRDCGSDSALFFARTHGASGPLHGNRNQKWRRSLLSAGALVFSGLFPFPGRHLLVLAHGPTRLQAYPRNRARRHDHTDEEAYSRAASFRPQHEQNIVKGNEGRGPTLGDDNPLSKRIPAPPQIGGELLERIGGDAVLHAARFPRRDLRVHSGVEERSLEEAMLG